MPITLKQISSLEKVQFLAPIDKREINSYSVLQGQRLSYQIAIEPSSIWDQKQKVWIESELADNVRLYCVKDVIVDKPNRENVTNENYLLTQPGMLPDILVPIEKQNNYITIFNAPVIIWVKIDIPATCAPGKYTVKFCVNTPFDENPCQSCEMEVNVLPAQLPEQSVKYTRWFYADCIADIHNAEIFSERHWKLIEEYIKVATDEGINMILVPTHTPPLDTAVGTTRPCVQLIDIEKKGESYIFGFEKFRRFIAICKKHGVKYYEMAHLFSQWGSKCAPNIMVTENGKTDYMFGWHVAADSEEYRGFLKQYIAAIFSELTREGIADRAYFHVSDEPNPDNLDKYRIARDIIKPLIGNAKTFDALSHYEFCAQGLVECPVTSVSHIHEFLEHDIAEQWVYYCCGPERVFTNSFIAMPSCRTRILGLQMYKYDIKGFLHWGYNFYNASVSLYKINPYVTTSSDRNFASGDAFIVYPGDETAYPSIRAEVTFEAMQDIRICRALEALIGREAVIAMIDEAASKPLRFDVYPDGVDFLEDLRAKMLCEIEKLTK